MDEEKTEITEETEEVTETADELTMDVPAEEAEPEDKVAPFRAASEQREQSAEIVAEHDTLLADVLYELTMQEIDA